MADEVLGSAVIEVGADTTGLRKDVDKGVKGAFSKTGTSSESAGRAASKRFGGTFVGGMKGIAVTAGAALGAGALIGIAKSSVTVAAEFEQTMNVLQSATGESARSMQDLEDLAIDMGKATVFSANEAATAMLELAKGGIKAAQIEAGALDSTLTLAAAGGLGLSEAASVASNALNAFNINAKDSGQIAAALAGGANASTASVESLAQALGQVGPGAVDAGLSLQETVAALAAFDNAGIKGSDAGTSLKTMLANLIPTTDKQADAMRDANLHFVDAQGNFVSLASIAGQLQRGLDDLSQAERSATLETIFGSDARRAASILYREGREGIEKYTRATNDQAAAEEMAQARMKGTKGALERLSGAWETAQLELGKALSPAIVKAADGLAGSMDMVGPAAERAGKFISEDLIPAAAEVVDEFQEWIPVIKDVGGDFTSALLPPLKITADVLGVVADVVDALPDPVKSLGVEAVILSVAISKVTASTAGMTAGLRTNMTALAQWRAEMSYAETRAGAVSTATQKMGVMAKQAAGIGGMLALIQGMSSASDEGQSFGNILTGTVGGALTGLAVGGPIGALIGAAGGGGLTALTGAFSDNKKAAEEQARALAEAKVEAAEHRTFIDALSDSLDRNTGAFTANSNEIIRSSFIDKETGKTKEWVQALNDAGIANRGIIAAVKGQPAAVKAVNDALAAQEATIGRTEFTVERLKDQYTELLERQRDWDPMQGEPPAWMQERLDDLADEIALNKANADALRDANKAAREGIDDGQEAQAQRQQEINDLARLHKVLGVTAERYREFPKSIRSELKITKLPESQADLNKLTEGVKGLTAGDWKILLKLAGNDLVGKGLTKAAQDAAKAGKAGGAGFTREMGDGLSKLPPIVAGWVKRATAQADNARSGGSATGTAFGQGILSGIHSMVDPVATEARAIVHAAIVAAQNEQRSSSPSKETEKLGKWFGQGFEKGLESTAASLVDTTKGLISRLLDSLGKVAKASAQRAVTEFRSAALPLAREIDRVNEKIRQMNDLRRSTTESVIGAFDITSAGTGFDSIVASMQQSAQQAGAWADALDELKDAGLNKTTMEQLIAAGPSSLTQAQALLGGDISQINALQSQINASARDAGKTAGQALYEGVKAQRARLANEFRHLAREFVREVRSGLRGPRADRPMHRARTTTTAPSARAGATPSGTRQVTQNINVEQNFYGLNRRSTRELDWVLKYGTGVKALAEAANG